MLHCRRTPSSPLPVYNLSAVVVVGLLVQWIFRARWIDGATALCLGPLLIHEVREAWEGEAAD